MICKCSTKKMVLCLTPLAHVLGSNDKRVPVVAMDEAPTSKFELLLLLLGTTKVSSVKFLVSCVSGYAWHTCDLSLSVTTKQYILHELFLTVGKRISEALGPVAPLVTTADH